MLATNPESVARPGAPRRRIGLWENRNLLGQLIVRDIQSRYRGSALGVFWSLLNPLFMLLVFAVVFGVIFEGRFTGHAGETRATFALQLFAGMVTFNFFAEVFNRAPALVVSSPTYVTKVVFPLEVLPAAAVGAALIHLLISLLPLLAGILFLQGAIPWTCLQWPLLLVPLVGWSLAVAWFAAALGVFVRDLQHLVATASLVLMYASAIFYPLARVPEDLAGFPLRALVGANPLAFIAESSRNACVWGASLDWPIWAAHSFVALVALWVGRAFFRRTQHAFADVL